MCLKVCMCKGHIYPLCVVIHVQVSFFCSFDATLDSTCYGMQCNLKGGTFKGTLYLVFSDGCVLIRNLLCVCVTIPMITVQTKL